jgi:hypothetical protein
MAGNRTRSRRSVPYPWERGILSFVLTFVGVDDVASAVAPVVEHLEPYDPHGGPDAAEATAWLRAALEYLAEGGAPRTISEECLAEEVFFDRRVKVALPGPLDDDF